MTIVETSTQPKKKKDEGQGEVTMIDTAMGGGIGAAASQKQVDDVKSYVLDEFRDILFPKAKSPYELAQERAAQLRRDQAEREEKQVRQKILALAQMMEYDDDIEESQVTQTRQKEIDHKDVIQASQKNENRKESKKQPEKMEDVLKDLGGDEDEEDSDDLLDDPAAFVER